MSFYVWNFLFPFFKWLSHCHVVYLICRYNIPSEIILKPAEFELHCHRCDRSQIVCVHCCRNKFQRSYTQEIRSLVYIDKARFSCVSRIGYCFFFKIMHNIVLCSWWYPVIRWYYILLVVLPAIAGCSVKIRYHVCSYLWFIMNHHH